MKQLRRFLRALAPLAAGVALASSAAAQPEGPPGRPFGRHGPPPIDRVLERHAEELGLSNEVLERVRAVAAAAEADSKALRDALFAEREAMRQLLEQDAPDPELVLHQAEVVGAAETEMHKQRLRTLLAVRALLTPDQRRELVRIFEAKRQRMGRHRMDDPEPFEAPAPPP